MYIYAIENMTNGKRYIGQTVSKYPSDRFSKHKYELKTHSHDNQKFQRAWDKYGSDVFRFSLLKKCNNQKELDEMEEYYISYFDSIKNGYNIKLGGHGKGITSEETKEKLRIANIGKKHKPLTEKQKIAKSLRARPAGYPIFISPDGYEIKITNMKAHCRQYNLDERHMKHLLNGENYTHKGWKIKGVIIPTKIEIYNKSAISHRKRIIKLISPSGVIYDIANLSQFCREHNLDIKSIRKLLNNKYKRLDNYKGWKNITEGNR